MDHLPRPTDSEPPDIVVPVLCFNDYGESMYDNEDFMTFPARQGYRMHTEDSSEFGRRWFLDLDDLGRHAWLDTITMLQGWLYFGLLHAAFDSLFCEADFVIQDSAIPRLNSNKLPWLVKEWRSLNLSNTTRVRDLWTQERAKMRGVVQYASDAIDDIELCWLDQCTASSSFPEIMLSIRILTQTLMVAPETQWRDEDGLAERWRRAYRSAFDSSQEFRHSEVHKPRRRRRGPPFRYKQRCEGVLRPSLLPLIRHMTVTKGWCPVRRSQLCDTLTPVTLYYLLCLNVPVMADHTICTGQKTCIAYNTNVDFVGRHVDADCTCQPITTANYEDMLSILEQGGTPVITASNHDDGTIDLRYAEAGPSTEYIAISHLWADGLGSPFDNRLVRCQLERLIGDVQKAKQDHLGQGPRRSDTSVTFWLDVYCIPCASDNLRANSLKQTAIGRMVSTYTFAQCVLIMDQGLRSLPVSVRPDELWAQLVFCGWNSRYWTHQELTLARFPLLQLSNGCVQYNNVHRPSAGADYDEPGSQMRYIFAEIEASLRSDPAGSVFVRATDTELRLGTTDMYRMLSWFSVEGEEHFRRTWNSFFGKASSKPEDMLAIFANLMDLSPDEIVRTPERDRVKAILNSLGQIPLGLLLDPFPLHQTQVEGEEVNATEESECWIPAFPSERGPIDSANNIALLTPAGLKIEESASLLFIKTSIKPVEWMRCGRLYLSVRDTPPQSGSSESHYYVEVPTTSQASIALLAHEKQDIVFVLEVSERRLRQGAALKIIRYEDNVVHTHYLCPIVWRAITDEIEITSRKCNPAWLGEALEAIRLQNDERIQLDCDVFSWPKVSRVRPAGTLNPVAFHFERHRVGLFIIWPLCMYSAAACAITLGIHVVKTPGHTRWWIVLLLTCTILGGVAIACLVLSVASTITYYLGMETFLQQDVPSRFWWERLARTLPKRPIKGRDDVIIGGSSFVMPLVHGIRILATALHWFWSKRERLSMVSSRLRAHTVDEESSGASMVL